MSEYDAVVSWQENEEMIWCDEVELAFYTQRQRYRLLVADGDWDDTYSTVTNL